MGVDHNLDDAARALGTLPDNLQDAADDAAKKTGDMFIRDSIQTMRSNGSVETTTGIRSFRNRQLGKGKYGVFAADYLEALDRGTTPHQPDTSNPRFQIWARSHGFTRTELAQLIAQQGTKPHPWIRTATKRTRSRKNDLVKIEVDDAMQKTSRKMM